MTDVEAYIDPGCPWAWITSRWLRETASQRDLAIYWRSYCLEIRDDYGVAPTVPDEYRQAALQGHALSHRMLRIFEAARAEAGEEAVDRLYAEWGKRYFHDAEGRPGASGTKERPQGEAAGRLLSDCVEAAGLGSALVDAADMQDWDVPIRQAMEVAYAFAGPKTQTPAIVVRSDPPYGFKGPVMAPAPTGDAAVRLWDAIRSLSEHEGFFEITRPRVNSPRDHLPPRPTRAEAGSAG